MSDEADLLRDSQLASLLAAHDDRLAASAPEGNGEAPPAFAERWQEDVELLRLLDRLRPRAADEPGQEKPETEGRYELLRPHASGGIGHVWVAHDADLDRDVALKELKPERAADPALIARFLHEARITGRLQHPGIVPVYELVPGGADEPPFYTMRLVRGQTLTEAARAYHRQRIEGKAKRLDFLQLLHAFLSVCNTIAYAHTRGVIHRDLKGQNVIVGDFAEVLVIDWGFAKILPSLASGGVNPLGGECQPLSGGRQPPERSLRGLTPPAQEVEETPAEQTQAGQLLGTPAYMAPEQAEGRLTCLDVRTDVFGLGAILYEILTGQPPFVGDNTAEVLRKARQDDVPNPRLIVPTASAALAAVCRRATARQPADRYSCAADLARELQHWLADEPVQAYREPWSVRCLRWMRRHRTAVAILLATLFTVSLLSGAGLAIIGEVHSRAVQQYARAEVERSAQRAALDEDIRRRLEEQLYFRNIALAERELVAHNVARAEALLNGCPSGLRGWEWFYLNRRCHEEPRTLAGHQATVSAIAFSPDGRRLASASYDRTLKVWDAASGRESFTLRDHGDAVYDVAFHPNGRLLASASWDGTVRLWDSETGRALRSFNHGSKVNRLAFRPDGRHLAIADEGGLVVRDATEGTIVARFPVNQSYRVVYNPAGSRLALTTASGIYLFDGENGRLRRRLPMPGSYVKCLAFHPDGRLFATGEGDLIYGTPGKVRLWDMASGALLFTFEDHSEPIFALAFSPDGKRLFSASQDKTVKVWDVSHRHEALTLRGHTDAVRGLAISSDGHRLATAGADGLLRLWDATPGRPTRPPYELRRLEGHRDAVFAAAFTGDGQRILSLDYQGDLKIWEAASGQLLAAYWPKDGASYSLAVSPDGRWAAVAKVDSNIHLYEIATGQFQRRLVGHQSGPIRSVAFSSDGRRLASGGWDRTVRIWPLEGGEPLVLRGHGEAVLGVAFRPDGRWIASASYDKTVRLWDATTGHCLHVLRGHASRVHSVAFSHSGRLLASADNDLIRLWQVEEGRLLTELRGHTAGVSAAVFSPDDRFLASAGFDRTVRLWDVAAAQELRTLRGHGDRVHSIAFSPDGRRLCSAAHDRTVRIWQFPSP